MKENRVLAWYLSLAISSSRYLKSPDYENIYNYLLLAIRGLMPI